MPKSIPLLLQEAAAEAAGTNGFDPVNPGQVDEVGISRLKNNSHYFFIEIFVKIMCIVITLSLPVGWRIHGPGGPN